MTVGRDHVRHADVEGRLRLPPLGPLQPPAVTRLGDIDSLPSCVRAARREVGEWFGFTVVLTILLRGP